MQLQIGQPLSGPTCAAAPPTSSAGEWRPNGRTVALIDPAANRVVQTVDAHALGGGTRLQTVLYPIHAASVGGWLYDLVVALSGLALAGPGGVGTWSVLVKPRRGRSARSKTRRSGLAPSPPVR